LKLYPLYEAYTKTNISSLGIQRLAIKEIKKALHICRRIVDKVKWKPPISLIGKDLQKNSKWLLTTGSVVRIRAGEQLDLFLDRFSYCNSLYYRELANPHTFRLFWYFPLFLLK